MRPYDYECAVLGIVLKYGTQAALSLLPDLTPDKFLFESSGTFGKEHARIWEAVSSAVTAGLSPTDAEISGRLPSSAKYLLSLVLRLDTQYRIYDLDTPELIRLAQEIDKQGVVYNIAQKGRILASYAQDEKTLQQLVQTIGDIDEWASSELGTLHKVMSLQSTGYTHIAMIVDDLKQYWNDVRSGTRSLMIDNGFPSFMGAHIFPLETMGVIHGLSGTGKSTLAFQLALGVAFSLVLHKIKGCVAINSLEMTQRSLVERLAAILARVDVSKFMDNSITEPEYKRLVYWAEIVAKLPIFVDGTNFITTGAMQYRAQGLHSSEHGPVQLLVSDYGELFKDDSGNNEEQRVSSVFRNQFNLSRHIGCSVIAISQSTVDKNISGKTFIAGPDGTRQSRGPLQAADWVGELWNPVAMEQQGRPIMLPQGSKLTLDHPYFFVQKFRNSATGPQISLGWIPQCTTFFDLALSHVVGQEKIFSHLDKALIVLKGGW